ncbi:Integrase [Qipengyuania citrea LAMA 915]|uniref:Integrase n=2 Tax=Qipengyuania citrea TaxID=225971 RepID=A0A0L1KGT7_9SPHN|nr:Integrase [Qipengyuania citrea LAMA 915]
MWERLGELRVMGKLTALKVKHAKAGRYSDGAGLYLLVSDKGAKSWLLRVMAARLNPDSGRMEWKRRDIGLGPLWDCTLEQARERAREMRSLARTGVDPVKAREAREERPLTFKEAAHACHDAKAPGWSEKHSSAFLSTLAIHAFPKIGSLPVGDVSERDVASALSSIWTSKPAAARKVRQRIGLVLDFAKASGWRNTPAPRQSLSTLLSAQPEGGNFASMPYADVPDFVRGLEDADETLGRLGLLFTIYTGSRNGEVRSARWSQFDLDARLWNCPASIMKERAAHTVTLSPQAVEVLERARAWRVNAKDCLVFSGAGGRRMSDATLSKLVRPLGYTVHGFRSSFRTWAAERMPAIPEAVAESALAHKIPDAVARAYNRAKFLEMRFTLLEAWGRYASGASGEVIQLPLGLRG